MSEHKERVSRLETRAREAENALQQLTGYLELLRKKTEEPSSGALSAEVVELEEENQTLNQEVAELRRKLVEAEIRNGISQMPLPSAVQATPTSSSTLVTPPTAQPVGGAAKPAAENAKPKEAKKKTKEGNAENPKKGGGGGAAVVDVSRLDFRVGRIVRAWKHPDADTLYCEEVDVGEEKMRSVCSGVVAFIPLEQMQNRMAVFLCNLKPMKMRGVASEAMVMCASAAHNIEIIDPPPGSLAGDRVTFDGYEGSPDAQLNPKKKVFETVQPELRTNEECVACYRGIPFSVPGKGVCRAQTMANQGIK